MCWDRIRGRFFWWGGKTYVAQKTAVCVACAHKNSAVWPAVVPPLKPIPVEPQAMWRIHGNDHHKLLYHHDELTSWGHLILCLKMGTSTLQLP